MTYRSYLTQNQDKFTAMKDKLIFEHKQRLENDPSAVRPFYYDPSQLFLNIIIIERIA
mgnify:CR=1 FL=1